MELNLISLINLVGIAQAIFFSIILFKLSNIKNRSPLYLALFLAAYALVQLNDVFEMSNMFFNYPHLDSILSCFVFLLGPLIFLYVKSLVKKDFKLKPKHLLHGLPYVMVLVLLIPYFIKSANEKRQILLYEQQHPDEAIIIIYTGILHVITYLAFSVKNIVNYSKDIKNYFSFTEKISLNWLVYLLVSLVVIWIAWVVETQFPILFLKYLGASMFTFFIYFLGFKGMNQPQIFNQEARRAPLIAELADVLPVKKYEKSGMPSNIIDASVLKLKQVMEEGKAYRNNQLTLSELASLIELPSHHLSQILNENLQSNFYDFVNNYRVDEIKQELLNTKRSNLTILALALDAGFNSKASFNKAFKKHAGMSPSEYKSQHQNASNSAKVVSPY